MSVAMDEQHPSAPILEAGTAKRALPSLTLGITCDTHTFMQAVNVLDGMTPVRWLMTGVCMWKVDGIIVTGFPDTQTLRFQRRGRVERLQWDASLPDTVEADRYGDGMKNTLSNILQDLSEKGGYHVGDMAELATVVLDEDADAPDRWDALGRLSEHHRALSGLMMHALNLEAIYGNANLDSVLDLQAPDYAGMQKGQDRLIDYAALAVILEPLLTDTESQGVQAALRDGKPFWSIPEVLGKGRNIHHAIDVIRTRTGCTEEEARTLTVSGSPVVLMEDATPNDAYACTSQVLNTHGLTATVINYVAGKDGVMNLEGGDGQSKANGEPRPMATM